MRLLWGVITLVLGAFVVMMAPLLGFAHTVAAGTSGVLTGLLIATFGIFMLFPWGRWASWVVAASGVWLLISSFVLGFTGPTNAIWATVTFGALAIVLGVLNFLTGGRELRGIGDIGERRDWQPSREPTR